MYQSQDRKCNFPGVGDQSKGVGGFGSRWRRGNFGVGVMLFWEGMQVVY